MIELLKSWLANPMVRNYGLAASFLIIIALTWFLAKFLFRNKKVVLPANKIENEADKTVEHEPVDVRLYDSITRTIRNVKFDWNAALKDKRENKDYPTIEEIKAKWRSVGRRWNRDGKWVYAINRYEVNVKAGDVVKSEIKYRPVEALMSPTRDQPPSKVHRALTHPEIAIYYDVTQQQTSLQKLMPVLIFAGAAIFIMFMWSQSGNGG